MNETSKVTAVLKRYGQILITQTHDRIVFPSAKDFVEDDSVKRLIMKLAW